MPIITIDVDTPYAPAFQVGMILRDVSGLLIGKVADIAGADPQSGRIES